MVVGGRTPKGSRAGALALTALLMLSAVAGAAAAAMPVGMDMGGARQASSMGATPGLGSYWVGPWTFQSGWSGLENALNTGRSLGITPVIYLYYWGDSISPSCVEHGCNGKSQWQWKELTRITTEKIRSHMGGQPVYVVLENEFNKQGITDSWYAPTFDAHLAARANELKAVPGVKVVLGFGSWGEDSWSKFPRAAAASDLIGFQMMRGSTRDSEADYRGAADSVRYYTDFIARTFNKPSFLYDIALSSYPDAHWERVQAETLSKVLDQVVSSGQTGLQGAVYRSLKDTYMDPKNYFGHAESHWGLLRADGSAKPAWNVWKAKATQASPAPTPAPSGEPITFTSKGGNEWWIGVSVGGHDFWKVTKVESRDTGGSWVALPKQTWGDYAGSYRIEAGHLVTFRATLNDGRIVESCPYTHPGGVKQCGASLTPQAPLTFTGKGGNEWWVGVAIGGSDASKVVKVESRDDGGAWIALPKQSWGDYAGSYRIEAGHKVYFRATLNDGRIIESCPFTHPGAAAQCSSYQASFQNARGGGWWIEVDVKASSLAGVDTRINGGTWVPLSKTGWGSWAKSMSVPAGANVEFRARSADGQFALSQPHAWPPQ